MSARLAWLAISSCHLSVFQRALEHVGQAPLCSPARTRLTKTPSKTRGWRHRLRQHLAALDVFQDRGDHLAEARILDAVADVAETVEQRDAGAGHLLHVEAEVDEVLPGDRDAAHAERCREARTT
jgi:hypothetical protein